MNECYMAVRKDSGQYFSGVKSHVGYGKIGYLKTAMTHAKVNKDDYMFIKLSFDENMTPCLTEIIKEGK